MCFAWISEQTEIISLYSINLSIFITEEDRSLRGTNWVFKLDSYIFAIKSLNDSGLKLETCMTTLNLGSCDFTITWLET
jgi:hypothetical protein